MTNSQNWPALRVDAGLFFCVNPSPLRRLSHPPEHRAKSFCGERWNRIADGFGSRADDFDSIVATEPPSTNRGFGEIGSPVHKACGGTSKPDGHAHHGRCIVAGAVANIRRCRRRTDQDESCQHRCVPSVVKIRARPETLPPPKRRRALGAPTFDQSEREPSKVNVPLPWVDKRAERRRGCVRRLSPTDALASESKFIKATLHTMPLRAEHPSHL